MDARYARLREGLTILLTLILVTDMINTAGVQSADKDTVIVGKHIIQMQPVSCWRATAPPGPLMPLGS